MLTHPVVEALANALYRRALEWTRFAGAAFVVDEEGEGSGLLAVT
jgi:hypothetical protein